WLTLSRREVQLIILNTPVTAWMSFGYKTFFLAFVNYSDKVPNLTYQFINPLTQQENGIAFLSLITVFLLSSAIAISIRKYWHIDLDFRSKVECQFLMGSAIYVGTFAIGANFNYKLVFLLFCIPQLMVWARNPGVQWSLKFLALAL